MTLRQRRLYKMHRRLSTTLDGPKWKTKDQAFCDKQMEKSQKLNSSSCSTAVYGCLSFLGDDTTPAANSLSFSIDEEDVKFPFRTADDIKNHPNTLEKQIDDRILWSNGAYSYYESIYGDCEWFKDGVYHRIGGPAYQSHPNIKKAKLIQYFKNGEFDRHDGAAMIKKLKSGKTLYMWFTKGKFIHSQRF